MIEVIPARPTHVGPIATRMREIDRVECAAMEMTPKQALRAGIMGSTCAWTMLVDGRPEAMFGAAPISAVEGRGRPWALLTDTAQKQKRALMRLGELYTDAMHRHYPLLENYVHAENDRSIRWLARLGYAVGPVDVIRGHPLRIFMRCAYRQSL